MKTAWWIPLLFFCSTVSPASVTEQLLDQLKSELKAEAQEARKNGDRDEQQQFYRLQELLMQVNRAPVSDEGEMNLQQTVESLGGFSSSEKVQSICKALTAELRTAQEARDKAAVDEMEKTFAEALRTSLAGKTAKDIDTPLVAVGKLVRENSNRNTRNAKLRTLANDGQQLCEFLQQWQDYLAASEAGNTEDARQKLQNRIGYGRDFSSFIPRSELLSRMNALKKGPTEGAEKETPPSAAELSKTANELVASIKTLDEIPAALKKLEAIQMMPQARSSSGALMEFGSVVNDLRSINQNYDDLKRGLGTRINLTVLGSSGYSQGEQSRQLAPLRYQLLLAAIPPALGLPDSEGIKPGENAATMLSRLLETAKTKQDWATAGKIADLAVSMSLTGVASSNETLALRSFLAGLNQERASQHALAVTSYQAALKSGSQIIAPEVIGAHLEAIKKANAEEYEKGMQLTLNPPLPPEGRYPYDPRYPMGRSYPPGYSPYGGRPTPTPPPVLEVPAKTPEAPAKAADAPPKAPEVPAKTVEPAAK